MKKQRTQKEGKIKPIVLGLVISISFGVGFLFAHLSKERIPGIDTEGILWPSPPKVNAFFLEDIEKNPFTLENLTGRWSILFFGFANCPDICPSTLQSMAKAERVLRSNPAFGESGQLIFVSVDPGRDTPEILKVYTNHFSPQLIAVTGPENELDILTRSVGAIYLKRKRNSKSYNIDHSAGLFFISPEGLLLSVLTSPIFDQGIIDRFEKVVSFRSKFL